MISFLARFFCKPEGRTPSQLRTAYGILCGAVGIGLNLLLFAGKFFAGTLSGSIAITADAFNNLSDAGSSVVTLLGFRIAAKMPDPDHPFGHGRAEYLSGLAVSMLILWWAWSWPRSPSERSAPHAGGFQLAGDWDSGGVHLRKTVYGGIQPLHRQTAERPGSAGRCHGLAQRLRVHPCRVARHTGGAFLRHRH